MNYLYEAIKPTRLYIKQCPHCGLKYFGKSTKQNIEKYPGSGTKWTRHLVKHDVKPIHLWNSDWYTDTSISRFALKFSNINKIVESNNWANLKLENGLDGGDTSQTPGFLNSLKNKKTNKNLTYEEIYGENKAKNLKSKRSESNRLRWRDCFFKAKTSKKISDTRKEKYAKGELVAHNKGKKVINKEFEQRKEKIRSDFCSSGLTRKQYAEAHSINYNTLKKYLRGL
jgi:hypothetical protein